MRWVVIASKCSCACFSREKNIGILKKLLYTLMIMNSWKFEFKKNTKMKIFTRIMYVAFTFPLCILRVEVSGSYVQM